jgi:hypothetical protein
MKLSVFNSKAPGLIKSFNSSLEAILNDSEGVNLQNLKKSVNGALNSVNGVSAMLNSVNKSQLLKLRNNATAGAEYGIAVDHVASLNSLLNVMKNMLDDVEPEESIDDILGGDEENGGPAPIDSGSEDASQKAKGQEAAVAGGIDENSDEDGIDDILSEKSEDCDKNGDTEGDTEVEEEEDEISPENYNFLSKTPAALNAKKSLRTNSANNSFVDIDFLK